MGAKGSIRRGVQRGLVEIVRLAYIHRMRPLERWMSETKVLDDALAEKVGVSRVQILRIRRGQNRPSVETARKLAEITGLPLEDLILNEEAA